MTGREAMLRRFLEAHRDRAFRPGVRDCAMFVADWIATLTGSDPAEPWRGAYRSLAEGRALLARDGFAAPSAVLLTLLVDGAGWMQARTGDVAVVIENGEEVLGIVGGPHIHALRPARGLIAVPRDRAVRIYRP